MIAISRVLIIVTLCFYSESNIYTNAPRSGQNTKLTPDAHIAAKMQENDELTSRELKVKCRINVLSKSPSFVFSPAALITLIAWITWTNFGHHNSSYHAQHHSTNAKYPSATMVYISASDAISEKPPLFGCTCAEKKSFIHCKPDPHRGRRHLVKANIH
jgi:hypothetical protein